MTEPVQSTPDDATLPGRADVTRVAASGDATLASTSPPQVRLQPTVSQLPARERYALGCEVARGGMGAILRATDLSIERTVAMKVALDQAADAEILQRFTQEAKLTGQLEHPNIVPVHDLSSDDQNRPFYTMKFVKGVTLHDILAKLKDGDAATVAQYSLAHLLTIYQKVCDAVAFAHSNSVIHRDLKPANIMVGKYGEVLVMDWRLAKVVGGQRSAISDQRSETVEGGVSRVEGSDSGAETGWARVSDPAHPPTEGLIAAQQTCGQEDGAVRDRRQTDSTHQPSTLTTQQSTAGSQPSTLHTQPVPSPALTLAGSVMGSPQYMAPEQAAGELDKLDARTDIFALGGILYNILTLHPPVNGTTVEEMLQQILAGEILPPSSYHTKTGRKKGGTIKVGEKTFPQPPLIPLKHCPGGRIPESLGAVAMKALALQQEDRYQSVPELQKDIEAYQGGFATRAEHASAWRQMALLVKRHKKEFALAAVALVVLLGTVTGFLVKVTKEKNRAEVEKQHAQTERDRAEKERQRAEVNEQRAEKTLGQLHDTAPTFYAQAQMLFEQRQWSNALEKASIAAALAPEIVDYHLLEGNLLQSSLRIAEARDAYTAALHRQPDHKLAKENLDLCEAFLREEDGSHPYRMINLSRLQTSMLQQGRTAEAGMITPFVTKAATDRAEALKAWKNILAQAGVGYASYLGYDKDNLTFVPAGGTFTNDTLAMFQGMPLIRLAIVAAKIHDLRPLQGMPLELLYLGFAPVTDLSPLQGMPLKYLLISQSNTKEKGRITDLAPLRGMPLEYLDVDASAITNLSPLQGMPLTNLVISQTLVADLTPLTGMRLATLDIRGTTVSDLSPLRGMPLKDLSINGPVHDMSPLKGLPLENLYIRISPVKDLSPLEGMPLKVLILNAVPADDLIPLKGLPLKILDLFASPVTDISPLRGMPLTDLFLLECAKIQDLTPLLDCRQLERLVIPTTCKNIECLRSHPTLKHLGYTGGAGPRKGVFVTTTVAEFWKAYDAAKTNAPSAKPTKP